MNNEQWNRVKGMDDFPPISDGDYEASISKANVKLSKNGDDMIVVEFVLLDEGVKGRKVWLRMVLKTDQNIQFAKRDLKRLGLDVDNMTFDELRNELPTLDGKIFEIQIVHKGDNQNVYLKKPEDVDLSGTAPKENEPF